MKSLKKIIYLLTRHEKVRAVWLLIMILSMALIDMMGIASIMPFIALLTNPEIIETNTILNFAYQKGKIFGIENEHQFLIAIGVFVFLLLIISITFKALTTYIQARFIKMCEYTIAKRLVERYLNQPYSWFLNRNSANLGKSILSEVGNVVGRGLEPMMSLVTNSLITFTLFFLLFVVEPKLSLIVIVIVCTFYGLIYKLNRNLMDKMGKENFKANESKFKVLNEAFGASKEVKVGGLEQIFINQFSKPAKIIAYNSAVVAISWATVFKITEVLLAVLSSTSAFFLAFLALSKKYFTFFLWIISISVPSATNIIIATTNPCIANGDTTSAKFENGLLLNIIQIFPLDIILYIFRLVFGQVRTLLNYCNLPSFLICSLILVAEIC